MAMMLMIVMMHSFTMMMTLIRPRHSPLHPDRFEALENTHSHSGASHAPVFQCVRISFNVCICISLNISICIFRTTIISALHTHSYAPVFQFVCISFNACFSICSICICVSQWGIIRTSISLCLYFFQYLYFNFCSICVCVFHIIRKHSLPLLQCVYIAHNVCISPSVAICGERFVFVREETA